MLYVVVEVVLVFFSFSYILSFGYFRCCMVNPIGCGEMCCLLPSLSSCPLYVSFRVRIDCALFVFIR